MNHDVVVVGSINQDLTVLTPRLPEPGETVLGNNHYTGGGGKGANQAVAAARLGGSVALVGCVGNDEHGNQLRSDLEARGVDCSSVLIDDAVGTGLAVITVDDRAENTIVVSPGANSNVTAAHIREHSAVIASAGAVLAQLEIPLAAVAESAGSSTGPFILNPAPARPLPRELLESVDVLIPNRSELARLAGLDEPETLGEAKAVAAAFPFAGVLVVTLGSDGALVITDGDEHHVEAPVVEAVDPTGAGDAFCGALALQVSKGADIVDAVDVAVTAGAIAATRHGAQDAMPSRSDLDQLKGR